MSPNDSYSQHVVTAVIVAHDGAAWLPHLLDALGEQTRPVQRIVAVDTGSRDRSGSVLTARLGQGAVFGMDRSTGYAAAVRRALQHKAASTPVAEAGSARGRTEHVEWLWLLHDDCEPAPDALEQLLRGAAESPTAAVLGPKLMDWANRNVIVEAGLALDTAGRRVTGVEPREIDQGQHDGDRDVMAVCSAGMLVRRDVWEQAGGFDPGMALFGEDIDFCWRVHAAGFRVRVITDAVMFHAAAATRHRRAISVGRRARLLDRRNGLITLLENLPSAPMLTVLAGNLALSLLRTVFYLFAKRPTAALDESAAIAGVLGHPLRLSKARRLRARGRRAAYGALRADLVPGRSIRRAAEFASSMLSRSSPQDLAGAHHATDDPDDDESLLTDSGVLQRLLTRPGVLLVIALIGVTIAAERSLITSGTLGGGALLPAFEGASGLWGQFLQAFHPAGVGSVSGGPPYVGLLALLATILLGKTWLAVDVLLLGCVPLAGITAFAALRRVTLSVPVRVWAAASYALLPVAFGTISAGRLGGAVAFVLIPVVGMLAGRMCTQAPKIARRAAWATGLAVTVGAAFVPLLWPIVFVAAVLAAVTLRRSVRSLLPNLAIVVLTPLVLLLPWLLELLPHPSGLLLEAGLAQPGLADAKLPARSLLLLSPGGPGLPPYWVSAALVLVGLAALLATRRFRLVVAGWSVALIGFAAALTASRATVAPAGGVPVTAWPGVALAVAAAGLLLAGAAAADGVGRTLSAGGRTGLRRFASARGLPVAVLALLACTAPLLAAAYWLMNGVSGPIGPAGSEVVPSIVSTTASAGRQLRTLVLASGSGSGHVSFLLLRGESPQFTFPDVTPVAAAQTALTKAVADLVAPNGGEAVNQSQQLARFDIGFVLMRTPIDASLASTLDSVTGLTEVSMTPSFDLWRLTILPSRVSVLEASGAIVPVSSGPIGVSGAPVPAAGGTLLLAEPAGGWSASVNGHGLTPVASPAGSWAQAFRLPPGGGTLTVSRAAFWHYLVMALELLAFVIVAALALPGIRSTAEIEAAATVTDGGSEADGDAAADENAEPARELVGHSASRRAAGQAAGSRAAAGQVATGQASAGQLSAGQLPAGQVPAGQEPVAQAAGGRAAAGQVAADRSSADGTAADRTAGAGGRSGRARREAGGRGRGRIGRRGRAGRKVAAAADGAAAAAEATAGADRQRGRRGTISIPARGVGGAAAAGRDAAAVAGSAAAGAAGVAGRAAGGVAAEGVATAGALAAGRRRRGPEIPPELPAGRPGAAWPAGQQVSRFVSGPPDDAAAAGYADRGRRASGYVDPPDYAQPSGYQGTGGRPDQPGYGDQPGYPAADDQDYRDRSYDSRDYGRRDHSRPDHSRAGYDRPDASSPDDSRAGYDRPDVSSPDYGRAGYDPAGSGSPGSGSQGYGSEDYSDRGYDGQPGYRSGRAENDRQGQTGGQGYGAVQGYGSGQGYPERRDHGGPRDYPGQPAYVEQPDYGSAAGYSGQGASWASDDQASSWSTEGRRHGRGGGHQPGGRPQGDQRAPSGGSGPGDSASGSSWPVPGQEPWPGQSDALEALPADEVHHDWPRSDGRPEHGWPAPGSEDEGEEW